MARTGYDFCKRHGGGRRCQHDGCQTNAVDGYDFCVRHGGGVRCQSSACSIYDTQPSASYRAGNIPVCWGCFVSMEPDKARLKVRREHYILAEVNRRLPELAGKSHEFVWDCRVPGGCSLKRPDMIFVFEDRYIQIEVDECGHTEYACCDEDARLEIIAADVGLPGLVLRMNPDEPPCFGKKRLRNGETAVQVIDSNAFDDLLTAACGTIQTYLAVQPPPTLVRLHFPAHARSYWALTVEPRAV